MIVRLPKRALDGIPEAELKRLMDLRLPESTEESYAWERTAEFEAVQAAAIAAHASAKKSQPSEGKGNLVSRMVVSAARLKVVREKIIRKIYAKRGPEDVGLGDTVERLLRNKWWGERLSRMLARVGLHCGCPSGRAQLNAQFPYPLKI